MHCPLFTSFCEKRLLMKIPNHIAIILDGNGRWAKKRGLPRTMGHTAGAKNVETIVKCAHDIGVKYITFYAFSTENWNRPKDEVSALMSLLGNYLDTCRKTAKKNNIRVRVIGDLSKLEPYLQDKIRDVMEYSKEFDGINMTIALNYGSRDEIVRAVKKAYGDVESGKLSIGDLNEEKLSSYLDTADLPDPDLMIRTSGEQRLSNYLLWQLAYSEFYFTEVPWPDFDEKELQKAIEAYNKRDRRFGGLSEEKTEV